MGSNLRFIPASWNAPKNIKALTTTRSGGSSTGVYESFNLGRVDADPAALANRALLHDALTLPSDPVWLKQVHRITVVDAAEVKPGVTADGAWTEQPGIVCAVLTADCMPVFLCDRAGRKVALLHAGWRGLAAGVIEAGVREMRSVAAELVAYLGPAIGPEVYEVGDEVRAAFLRQSPRAAAAFVARGHGHWLADLYALARQRLHALGVTEVSGGERCTVRERGEFFSYRRDGDCGRMASLIWIE